MYYLIDLERSISSGLTTYWKPNNRGYTQNIKEAGLYSKSDASEKVSTDFDQRTVMVEKEKALRLVGIEA